MDRDSETGTRCHAIRGDDTVIATGSSWRADEGMEGHLLAGRAGTSGLRRVRIANAQTKIYLADPVLAWLAPLLRAGLPSPDFTALTEQVLASAMARALDNLEPGRWIAEDTIGYVRTSSGQEVDLAPVPVPSSAGTLTTVPVESKWVDRGWRSEAKVVEGKYVRGILATKTLLDLTHPTWATPAPLVALLLA